MRELSLTVRLILLYLWELGITVSPRKLQCLLFCLHSGWLWKGNPNADILFGKSWPSAYPSGPFYEDLPKILGGIDYDDPILPAFLIPGSCSSSSFIPAAKCLGGRIGLGKSELEFITEVLVFFGSAYDINQLGRLCGIYNQGWSDAMGRDPLSPGSKIQATSMKSWFGGFTNFSKRS